jgi:hypothetical protein
MSKISKMALITILIAIILLIILGIYKFNFTNNHLIEPEIPSAPTQLANPASANCLEAGGNLKMDQRGDGGEYGLCYFDDNRACEEWAMMRGECPVGGVKTTGYDTIDQKYCAWAGGSTLAEANSTCIFKNGSTCPTIDFYNGTCYPAAQ